MMSERARPAVRVITCESISATAAERFMAQYDRYRDDFRFGDRKVLGEVRSALAPAEKTYEGLKGILNSSWLLPACDLCGKEAFAVAETTQEYGGGERRVCLTCAQAIVNILSAFPRAADKA